MNHCRYCGQEGELSTRHLKACPQLRKIILAELRKSQSTSPKELAQRLAVDAQVVANHLGAWMVFGYVARIGTRFSTTAKGERYIRDMTDLGLLPGFLAARFTAPHGLHSEYTEAVDRYLHEFTCENPFVLAVLENDLRLVVSMATPQMIAQLPLLVEYIEAAVLPYMWGTKTFVRNHLLLGEKKRQT